MMNTCIQFLKCLIYFDCDNLFTMAPLEIQILINTNIINTQVYQEYVYKLHTSLKVIKINFKFNFYELKCLSIF